MIGTLNALVDAVEQDLSSDVDIAALASDHGTTEYHLRRMFVSLAGMPVSEYIRRRRMTLAAAELILGATNLLDVAVKYGYGSTEAFGRAFRAVHGHSPAEVRDHGGPINTQPTIRFHLRVEGSTTMDVTIKEQPDFRIAGYSAEVPLIYEGVNPHIQEHVASISNEQNSRLKTLGNTQPEGILAVTWSPSPDAPEGTILTYMHGVAVSPVGEVPGDLDTMDMDAGKWAVFYSEGPFPEALQQIWAATATEWFPSNPWHLRPGPSILRYIELTETHATCELWLPVEPSGRS